MIMLNSIIYLLWDIIIDRTKSSNSKLFIKKKEKD